DPADHDVVYASATIGATGVYKSIDGGAHWTDTPMPMNASTVALSTSTRLLAGTQNGVFLTTDGATSWQTSNAGFAGTSVRSLAVDTANPGKVYAGMEFSSVARSADGGDTWTDTAPFDQFGAGITAVAVDPTAPGTVYAGDFGTRGVFKTVDDGANWNLLG